VTASDDASGRSISPEDAMQIVQSVRFRAASPPRKRETIKDRLDDIGVTDAAQNVRLRRHLAYWAFGVVALQLACYNAAFMSYGWVRGWRIESQVMMTWMATGLAEILGIVLIIAKNLYPDGTGKQSTPSPVLRQGGDGGGLEVERLREGELLEHQF
jgi:hypothetical protein